LDVDLASLADSAYHTPVNPRRTQVISATTLLGMTELEFNTIGLWDGADKLSDYANECFSHFTSTQFRHLC
jgi:hypothetical protein